MERRTKKPRVLLIGPTPPPYHGVSVMTSNILDSSLRDNFELLYLNTSDNRDSSSVGKIDFLEGFLFLKHFLTYCCFLMRSVEIVHIPISQTRIGFLRDLAFILFAMLPKRTKVVLHLHGSSFRNMLEICPSWYRLLISYALSGVSGAIVLGEKLRYLFHGLVPNEKVFVVPNGIPDPGLSKILRSDPGKFIVTYLGNLVRGKGFFNLLEAIPLVVHSNPNIHFNFIGRWRAETDRREALEYVSRMGINNHVLFKGEITGVEKLKELASCAVFVFPPYQAEGQPLVILEAMGCGLPIVATSKGAIDEMVVNNDNGFIVPEKSAESIANRIIQLASDHNLCQGMGYRSRELFMSLYTVECFAHRLRSVWNAVLCY